MQRRSIITCTGAVWRWRREVARNTEGGGNHSLLPGFSSSSVDTSLRWTWRRAADFAAETASFGQPLSRRSGKHGLLHRHHHHRHHFYSYYKCNIQEHLEQSVDGPQTAGLVLLPFQTVDEDVFILNRESYKALRLPTEELKHGSSRYCVEMFIDVLHNNATMLCVETHKQIVGKWQEYQIRLAGGNQIQWKA